MQHATQVAIRLLNVDSVVRKKPQLPNQVYGPIHQSRYNILEKFTITEKKGHGLDKRLRGLG